MDADLLQESSEVLFKSEKIHVKKMLGKNKLGYKYLRQLFNSILIKNEFTP